jgi:hypothetical protein
MKYITTTLMLIVGFQFSVCAETLVFEKVVSELEFPEEYVSDYNPAIKKINNAFIPLGTIRLEIGETLTLGEIKHMRARNVNREFRDSGNDWIEMQDYYASFNLELKYDLLSKEQKIDITNTRNRDTGQYTKWSVGYSSEYISGTEATWPIEGPVTISVSVKPYSRIVYNNSQNTGVLYKIDNRPEQYLRIIFKKEQSSIYNNQSKQQVLVLPKDSKNTNVIMESSEDLVNWTSDSLGPKNTADGHRFFRLRAVKE